MKSKIKNTISLTIPKKMKYLGVNLTKHIRDLYAENYKTVIEKIKDLHKQRYYVHGRLNIVKISILPKLMTGVMQFLIILARFL